MNDSLAGASTAMLSVQDVHTYYRDSYILQGVTLEVCAGQVVGLLGRNGVGKTTLARSILGLTPAREGRILFRDNDITRLPAHTIARMGVGFVPQGRHVFRSLTVSEHLHVTARGSGPWNFEQVVELFPILRSRLRSPSGTLSGGEQQMLAAALLPLHPDNIQEFERLNLWVPSHSQHGDEIRGTSERTGSWS